LFLFLIKIQWPERAANWPKLGIPSKVIVGVCDLFIVVVIGLSLFLAGRGGEDDEEESEFSRTRVSRWLGIFSRPGIGARYQEVDSKAVLLALEVEADGVSLC
jgi:hypothetical protein